MKNKSNKRKLESMIGTFNLAEITSVKTDDGRILLDEADMVNCASLVRVGPAYLTQMCLSDFCIG